MKHKIYAFLWLLPIAALITHTTWEHGTTFEEFVLQSILKIIVTALAIASVTILISRICNK